MNYDTLNSETVPCQLPNPCIVTHCDVIGTRSFLFELKLFRETAVGFVGFILSDLNIRVASSHGLTPTPSFG